MQAISKDNLQQHCLTCLLELDKQQKKSNSGLLQGNSTMSVLHNTDLQQMIAQHLHWLTPGETNDAQQLMPQQMCNWCFQQLQSFDKFHKLARNSYEQLQKLLANVSSSKLEESSVTFEIIYQQTDEAIESSMPSKNAAALLEPETILPDNIAIKPDPFATTQQDSMKRAAEANNTAETSQERCQQSRSFKCSTCLRCFGTELTLSAHIRRDHEGCGKPFKCNRCDRAYRFAGGLYTHIKEVHEVQERSYACDYANCERIYTSTISLVRHKRLKHTNPLPDDYKGKYVCELCGATFNQSANLKYHQRTKHPTPVECKELLQRHYCTICNKEFHSRYTLKYHTLQKHSSNSDVHAFGCKICGHRVAKKFMLAQHMLTHTKDRLPCEHCEKSFTRNFELESHVRAVHLKLKPFVCSHCDERFASRKTLRHHEYIHTGEKPYVCDICEQAFRQQTVLRKHMQTHDNLKN